MNIFALRRKLPDGRPAMGPLFYIIIALGILGLFVYYNVRMSGNPKPAATRAKGPDVDKVVQAANAYKGTGPEKETPKGKLPVGTDPGGNAPNTSIIDNLSYIKSTDSKVSADKNKSSTGELPVSDPPPPRVQPVAPQATPPVSPYKPTIIYNFTPTPTPYPIASPTPAKTGFQTNKFLPRGALIPVYVLSTIKTGTLEDLVVLGVAENVIFNHDVQLPFGTRLLGSAAASGDGDRIAINVDTALFPNGEELPISGLAKDIDRGPGIRAYYIPQPVWVTLLPYVNNFIAAYLNTLQKTVEATTTAYNPSTGGTTTEVQQVADMTDTQTALVSSASNALMNATQVTMDQINKLYKAYLVIPPGTPAFVQLRQATDITRKAINGSVTNPMPSDLPGFSNNKFPVSGLQPLPQTDSLSGQNGGVPFIPNIPAVQNPQVPSGLSGAPAIPDMTDTGTRFGIQGANQQGLTDTLTPVPQQSLLPLE